MLRQMGECGFATDTRTFNTVLAAAAKSKEPERAALVFNDMRTRHKGAQPDIYTFNTMINAHGRAGDWQQVVALLEEMRAPGAPVAPDIISFNTAMGAYVRNGQIERAVQLMELLEGRGEAGLITFNVIIAACARNGRQQLALEYFDRALTCAFKPDLNLFNAALFACSKVSGGRRAGGGERLVGCQWLHTQCAIMRHARCTLRAAHCAYCHCGPCTREPLESR